MIVNELRIGNIVRQLGTFTESTVTTIDSENQTISTLYVSERTVNDFDGVLLTHSKLLEFGFSKVESDLYVLNGYFASFDADRPLWIGKNGCCERETIKEGLIFVHQLQNIYFALTGNELKIIEKP